MTTINETTEERYDDMLGALPPAAYSQHGFLVGEPMDHRACKVTDRLAPTYAVTSDKAHTEPTPAGPQHVLPGAERVRSAVIAKQMAAAPLRPNKPQAQCDLGLFSDNRNQLDLL